MCGATEGGLPLDGIDVAKEAIIQGQVLRGSSAGQADPVSNAYVRLLDRTGEFTAEVPTSATGHFRFFAGPGDWTLRTLAPKTEPVDIVVTARRGSLPRWQKPSPPFTRRRWFMRRRATATCRLRKVSDCE